MPPPRRYATEAIVIRQMDYAEADRILTLFTTSRGKLHAIAKGVRRAKSRSAGHLDLFTRSSVLIAQGRNLGIVSEAHMVEPFAGLRVDLRAAGTAHYACELVDSFLPDNLPNGGVYELLILTLRGLATDSSSLTIRHFEMRLLDVLGYRPELWYCVNCGSVIQPGPNRFSAATGGIICPNCHTADVKSSPISDPALKLLRNLQRSPGSVMRLRGVDERVNREIEARLGDYIAYRLEKRPKSVDVLARVEERLKGATRAG